MNLGRTGCRRSFTAIPQGESPDWATSLAIRPKPQ